MHSINRDGAGRGKRRTAGASLVIESLNRLANRRGLILDEVNWFTHPSEETDLATYTLLVSSQEKLEELVFLREELECLPHSAYTRTRIDRLLVWAVDALCGRAVNAAPG